MKKLNVLILVLLFAGGVALLENCGTNTPPQALAVIDSCVAPSSWFPHSQTPSPEEGTNSPFADDTTTTNCDFHLWSWQKFLYLTRTAANGRLNFENLVQVDNQMKRLSNDTLILDDTTQAGTATVLLDKSNHPIYYAIYMDSTMYNFANEYTELFITNCGTGNGLDSAKMKQFGYDTLTYPVGSFEVKTSWILASSLAQNELADYYTTSAMLNNQMTQVALIGMHIVGRVINHPEFIWATFDHQDLAPTVQWPQNILTDSIPDPAQILSNSNSLFYYANLPMDSCSIKKSSTSTAPFKSIYHLFDHGTQVGYNGITQAAAKQDSANLSNINILNNSVLNNLTNDGDLWRNYVYFGSIWIDPTTSTLQPGDGSIGSLDAANLRGSRALSNITMETYIQFLGSNPTPTKSFNCFGCHNTVNGRITGAGGYYDLALSHLFNNKLNEILNVKNDPAKRNSRVRVILPE
jgi:hypothetical protein